MIVFCVWGQLGRKVVMLWWDVVVVGFVLR